MTVREIKFRAFEKTLNEIIPVFNIDFEKKMINTNSAWRTFGEVELMQCTGLKDKNGVEIYEGDIIDCNGGFGEVILDSPVGQWSTKQVAGKVNIVDPLWIWCEDYEILGNIYENPELLEVNK